ncbi:hypothetical protein Clacol_000127 [Clathrus columnatus]|uniref:F-box domain-containing protein n=1 Tax=Clathrus columnatus TaxID=1419009 RepID=A0AAV4ZWN3_9AGAM|nr:hypothetical protein Clacol_000127 [Clathrus columnatus]
MHRNHGLLSQLSQETNPSNPTEKNTLSRQESLVAKSLQKTNVGINQLPVETLIKIITLTEYPGVKKPYPSIPFSWVCRSWRSAVLGHTAFWRIIVFDWNMTPTLLQEVLKRSQAAPLEVSVEHGLPSAQFFWDGLRADASRVKTLHMNTRHSAHPLQFSDLLSFFSSLDNIFYTTYRTIDASDSSFEDFVQCNVKALRVSVGTLGCLAMPGCFLNLCWLDLEYGSSIPLSSLLKAMQNLPNLQVLYLHLSDSPPDYESDSIDSPTLSLPDPIITLHELRVLITEHSIPHLVDAPKLAYLEISEYPANDDNNHFGGFDFSTVTDMSFEISDLNNICIMGYNKSEANFSFFFGNVNSIFDPMPTSYLNKFHISLQNPTQFEKEDPSTGGPHNPFPFFAAVLQKTINLRKILLDCSDCHDSPENESLNYNDFRCFLNVFKSAIDVRELLFMWGCSFPMVCDLLSDGALFPHLEKLTYVNGEDEPQTISDLEPLQNLMKERSTRNTIPLEIELQNFPPVQSELLEKIGNLGIRITQIRISRDLVQL